MDLIIIMLSIFALVVIAHMRTPRDKNVVEVLPATKVIEIEVIDEMTKEKVRNLYEEQDIYNAKISYLIRTNKQYEAEMEVLNQRIQNNLNDMRVQARIQPNISMEVLKASYESSNKGIHQHMLKLEGIMLTNAEKIIQYKKKSNAISEQIDKIGKEIYAKSQAR